MAEDAPRFYIDIVGDLFHAGHLRHLEKAKALGGTLVVGIFDDATAARLSHVPVNSLEERVAIVSALRCVDEVVPAAAAAPDAAFLNSLRIDTVCLTDDFGDPERQGAMATLLDEGNAVVLPYTEALTTAAIVSRITGDPAPATLAGTADRAAVNAPAPKGPDQDTDYPLLADALGSIAAGIFGHGWMMAREGLGSAQWLSLFKAAALNRVDRQARIHTDPRFVAALASFVSRRAQPGDRINLIGNPMRLVGPALAAAGHPVTLLHAGAGTASAWPETEADGCRHVYCSLDAVPDALPPAEITGILDPAWSVPFLVDGAFLFSGTFRLARDLILVVNFEPGPGGGVLPSLIGGRFAFSDRQVRNVLHGEGFFDVEDIQTTLDGAPMPADTRGCGRASRVTMIEEERKTATFRYRDGGGEIGIDTPGTGKYLRWYRASKLALKADGE